MYLFSLFMFIFILFIVLLAKMLFLIGPDFVWITCLCNDLYIVLLIYFQLFSMLCRKLRNNTV